MPRPLAFTGITVHTNCVVSRGRLPSSLHELRDNDGRNFNVRVSLTELRIDSGLKFIESANFSVRSATGFIWAVNAPAAVCVRACVRVLARCQRVNKLSSIAEPCRRPAETERERE